ncbi:hypothetical protein GCM10010451_57290 [Streptomyces virens]|uniref:Uncharacterized protein n=1 Tax=Streptomyces virens TaxID=285572 RepID=A0ABP6Q0S2_9ACTN
MLNGAQELPDTGKESSHGTSVDGVERHGWATVTVPAARPAPATRSRPGGVPVRESAVRMTEPS